MSQQTHVYRNLQDADESEAEAFAVDQRYVLPSQRSWTLQSNETCQVEEKSLREGSRLKGCARRSFPTASRF